MTEMTNMRCSDCGNEAREMTKATLNKGNTVREPGEALCGGCSARRVLMVRQVKAIPDSLDKIRALRMAPVGSA